MSLMKITEEYLEELDKLNYTPLHKALEIVNTLLDNSIRKEVIPIGNKYNLIITASVKDLIKDWLSLWTQEEDNSYNIAGNKVYVKIGEVNSITKIIDITN